MVVDDMRRQLGAMLQTPVRWARARRGQQNDNRASWAVPFEFLHTAFAHLLEEPDSSAPFNRLLEQIESYVGANTGVIFIFPEADGPLAPWAWTPGTDCIRLRRLLDDRLPSFVGNDCEPVCLPFDEERVQCTVMVVGLNHGAARIGLLVLGMSGSPEAFSEHVPLLKKLGVGIATMIHSVRRARINRSEALREERAAIARDLHDSLAQSLSYGKIQVSRLQSLLRGDINSSSLRGDINSSSPWRGVEMDSVVQELRGNLNMAYRQLRELITTCRLTMDGRSLDQALEDSVDEFEKRSGIVFALDNRMVGVRLRAEEEMQVLHIIREALSNIVRHAHAKHAIVRLFSATDATLNITIADDGTGMVVDSDTRDPHHGLMIMQERTHRLGGDFSLGNNDGGGTSVYISFMPKSVADAQPPRARVRHDDAMPTNRIDHR